MSNGARSEASWHLCNAADHGGAEPRSLLVVASLPPGTSSDWRREEGGKADSQVREFKVGSAKGHLVPCSSGPCPQAAALDRLGAFSHHCVLVRGLSAGQRLLTGFRGPNPCLRRAAAPLPRPRRCT